MKLGVSKKIILSLIGALLIALASFSVLGIIANNQKYNNSKVQVSAANEYTFSSTYSESKETWLKKDDALYINNEIFDVGTPGGLMNFSRSVGEGGCTFEGKTVRLYNNIDMTGYNFIPIGADLKDGEYDTDVKKCFSGEFNGMYYTISNISTKVTKYDSGTIMETIGFFPELFGVDVNKKAQVLNLRINEFSLNVSGGDQINIGGIAGQMENAIINNCVIENFVVQFSTKKTRIVPIAPVCGGMRYNSTISTCCVKNYVVDFTQTDYEYSAYGYGHICGIAYWDMSPDGTTFNNTINIKQCLLNNGEDPTEKWNATLMHPDYDKIYYEYVITNVSPESPNYTNYVNNCHYTKKDARKNMTAYPWYQSPEEPEYDVYNEGWPYLKDFISFRNQYFYVEGGDEIGTINIYGDYKSSEYSYAIELPSEISSYFDKSNIYYPTFYGCAIAVEIKPYYIKRNYGVVGWRYRNGAWYAQVADTAQKCEVTFKYNTSNNHMAINNKQQDFVFSNIATGTYLTQTSASTNYESETTTYFFKVSYFDSENILRENGIITYTVNMCYSLALGQEEIFIHGPMTIDLVFVTEYFKVRFRGQSVEWEETTGPPLPSTTTYEAQYAPQYYVLQDDEYVSASDIINTQWGLSVMKNQKIKGKIEDNVLYYQLKVYEDFSRKTYDMLVVYEMSDYDSYPARSFGYVDVTNKTVTNIKQFTYRPTDTDLGAEEVFVKEDLEIIPTFEFNLFTITFQDIQEGEVESANTEDEDYKVPDDFVRLTDDEDDEVYSEFSITGVYGGSQISYIHLKPNKNDDGYSWYDNVIVYSIKPLVGEEYTVATYRTNHSKLLINKENFAQYVLRDAIIEQRQYIDADLTIKPVFKTLKRQITFNQVQGMELWYNNELVTESVVIDNAESGQMLKMSSSTQNGITSITYQYCYYSLPIKTITYKILDKRYCLGNYGVSPQTVTETTASSIYVLDDLIIAPQKALKSYEIQYPILEKENK